MVGPKTEQNWPTQANMAEGNSMTSMTIDGPVHEGNRTGIAVRLQYSGYEERLIIACPPEYFQALAALVEFCKTSLHSIKSSNAVH